MLSLAHRAHLGGIEAPLDEPEDANAAGLQLPVET
jgi:hypothetical protein